MKGTFFSADFIKDSSNSLRLLEMNTDTSVIAEQIPNADWAELISTISDNSITKLAVIYKTVIHENLVNNLLTTIGTALPDLTIEQYAEDQATIYPTSIDDADDIYILRFAYDESALFDSSYCKNRLNSYKLFVTSSDSGSDFVSQYYYSSSLEGTINTLTYEVNPTNIPDVSVKDLDETSNPIDFYKLGKSGETNQQRWEGLIATIDDESKIVEQYHYHSSSVDADGNITSYRTFYIVHGSDLDTINILSYKNSALFDLPTDISTEVDNEVYDNKLEDYHYYEYTTNAFKIDGGGLLSTDKIQLADGSYTELSNVQVGDAIKSFFISGSPQVENDYDTLNWNYSGSEFPSGSYVTSSNVVFKNTENLHYHGLIEYVVNDDSQFSGTSKQFLVFDSGSGLTGYKHASELDPTVDYFYDFEGNLIDLDAVNYYITSDDNISIVELDVEDTDTYIISGSTSFNNVVSHNNPCFVAGTQIAMGDGSSQPIENIVIGSLIKTYNHHTNIVEDKKVRNVLHKKVDETVKYTFGDISKELECTHDHPIWSTSANDGTGSYVSHDPELSRKWYQMFIPQSAIGQTILLADGSTGTISAIEEKTENVTVYNLQDVEDNHNFFANQVLVHNRCFVAGTKVFMADGSEKNIEDVVDGDVVWSYNFGEQDKEGSATDANPLGYDLEAAEKVHREVTNTQHFTGSVVAEITFDVPADTLEGPISITCTQDHPFFKPNGTLASVNPNETNVKYGDISNNTAQLAVGDEILSTVGNVTVSEIRVLWDDTPDTYIITVDGTHNFYANQILVHNK
jgi:hypothetical protein